MISPNVEQFLRKARSDGALADKVRAADAYESVAHLSAEAGAPSAAGELREAFVQRHAGVLVDQMVRRGVIEPLPIAAVPSMDDQLWNRIAALDLSPVASQLRDYQGWSNERTVSVERRYRRFLYLKATLPKGMASPTREVDEFWHQHIINTRRYGPDCRRVAGRYLHHTFLSLADDAQSRQIRAIWLATLVCYETLFEEPYEETVGMALLNRWQRA